MRIRTVKPEFWRNRKLASLGREVHGFAARLLNAADDEGFFEADPALLAGDLLPFDTDAQRFIRKAMPELERIGFVEVRGGENGVAFIPKFREHQRINRPSKSRLRVRFEQVPATTHFSESSVSPHGALSEPSPTEVEREQGKGTGKGNREAPGGAGGDSVEALRDVWNANRPPECPEWRTTGPERERAAKARLKELPDLGAWVEVVKRLQGAAFARGRNDRGWVADPDFLLRPDSRHKILEGKYDRGTGPPARDVTRGMAGDKQTYTDAPGVVEAP